MKYLVLLVVVLMGVFLIWIKNVVEIDRCLDHGGRWKEVVESCEFS